MRIQGHSNASMWQVWEFLTLCLVFSPWRFLKSSEPAAHTVSSAGKVLLEPALARDRVVGRSPARVLVKPRRGIDLGSPSPSASEVHTSELELSAGRADTLRAVLIATLNKERQGQDVSNMAFWNEIYNMLCTLATQISGKVNC